MLKVINENLGSKKFDYTSYAGKVARIDTMIEEKSGPGNDYTGWVNLPSLTRNDDIKRIQKYAEEVRKNYDILVVCGIGGSYLGARAAIDALKGLHSKDKLEIIFLGQTFSSDYIYETLEYLKGKKFAVNVISKSGTTTETSISFRLLRELLVKEVGEENAKKAIFATTDSKKGALHEIAKEQGYVTFDLPRDVGGRYSVLTPVGLFPMACAGIDIQRVIEGAREAELLYSNANILHNEAYKYGVARDYLYRHGKCTEMFVTYEPRLTQLGEWYKQLFGESEGKECKGLFPASATFSTDLHSLGQYIQDGTPLLFETILNVKKPNHEVIVPECEDNRDELNYLAGKSMEFVNQKAFEGTLQAHAGSGVPNLIIEMDELKERELGHLFYFFMKACAMSAYLLEINPFNQPGVEVYKKNMFHLLGKKGY